MLKLLPWRDRLSFKFPILFYFFFLSDASWIILFSSIFIIFFLSLSMNISMKPSPSWRISSLALFNLYCFTSSLKLNEPGEEFWIRISVFWFYPFWSILIEGDRWASLLNDGDPSLFLKGIVMDRWSAFITCAPPLENPDLFKYFWLIERYLFIF